MLLAEWLADRTAITAHMRLTGSSFMIIATTKGTIDSLDHFLADIARNEIIYQNHVSTAHGPTAYGDARLFTDERC